MPHARGGDPAGMQSHLVSLPLVLVFRSAAGNFGWPGDVFRRGVLQGHTDLVPLGDGVRDGRPPDLEHRMNGVSGLTIHEKNGPAGHILVRQHQLA